MGLYVPVGVRRRGQESCLAPRPPDGGAASPPELCWTLPYIDQHLGAEVCSWPLTAGITTVQGCKDVFLSYGE